MSNGYASDTSTESGNKRARRVSFGTSAADGGLPAKKYDPRSPIGVAFATANRFIETLHPTMRNSVQEASHPVIQSFATWLRKRQAYLNMKNDPDYIPQDARIKVTLHPVEGVASSQGFRESAAKTAEVVKQCQLLLRDPILECTALNVEQLLTDVHEAFVSKLPKLAELIIAEEVSESEVSNYGMHQTVADLVGNHQDEILSFLRLQPETFKTLYCKVHGLNSFPTPSRRTPSTPIAANNSDIRSRASTTAGGSAAAGGTGGGGAAPAARNNSTAPPEDAPPPAAAAAPAATAGASTEVEIITPATPAVGGGPPPTARETLQLQAAQLEMQTQQQPQQQQQPILTQAATATPSPGQALQARANQVLGIEQRTALQSCSTEQMAAIMLLLESVQQSTTPLPEQRPDTTAEIQEINNPYSGSERMEQSLEDDVEMSDAEGTVGTSSNSDLLKDIIRRRLLAAVEGAFVRPIHDYNEQVKASNTALRIKKVATKQSLHHTADKTAEALAAEVAVDPKLVRVMIQQSAAKEVKKALDKKEKTTSANKQSTSSKSKVSGGARGSAAQKNKSASRNAAAPSTTARAAAGGGRNDSDKGNSASAKRSSRNKSKKKSDATKTKRSKSSKASKRK